MIEERSWEQTVVGATNHNYAIKIDNMLDGCTLTALVFSDIHVAAEQAESQIDRCLE